MTEPLTELLEDRLVPRFVPGCRLLDADGDESVLLVPEGALRLKGSASDVVKLIDGQRSILEIVAALAQNHSAASMEQISGDVRAFLEKLRGRNLIAFDPS